MDAGVETRVDLDELASRSAAFETAPAGKVMGWAAERFGGSLSLACSFQDCVIIDLAVEVDPDIEVLFLDTGFHFPETLAYVEEVRARYDLNLRVMTPGPEAEAWPCGTERCCDLRKVEPLNRALEGRAAWMTGLKRCDAPTRAAAPIVSWDAARGLVKINPVATWTDADIAALRGRPRPPRASPHVAGVPVDRLRAHDASGGGGRGPPGRALGGHGQDRVRPARLMVRDPDNPWESRSGATSGRCTSCIPTAISAS